MHKKTYSLEIISETEHSIALWFLLGVLCRHGHRSLNFSEHQTKHSHYTHTHTQHIGNTETGIHEARGRNQETYLEVTEQQTLAWRVRGGGLTYKRRWWEIREDTKESLEEWKVLALMVRDDEEEGVSSTTAMVAGRSTTEFRFVRVKKRGGCLFVRRSGDEREIPESVKREACGFGGRWSKKVREKGEGVFGLSEI